MSFRERAVLTALLSLIILCVPASAQVHRLSVSPDFVFFTQTGTTAPAPVQVKITSATSAVLGAYTAKASTLNGGTWLSVTPAAATGPATLTVSANTTGLAAGEYVGTVTITAAGFANSPYSLGVSLTILAPALIVHPSLLSFSAISGGAAPAAQSLMISESGGGSFSWTTTATVTTPTGGKWLKVSNAFGSNAATVSVSVDPTGLAAGKYEGQVQVNSTVGTATSSVKVPVTLTVTAPKPPALQLNPTSLTIVFDPSKLTPGAIPTIQVTNSGSGTISYAATVAVDSPTGGKWLTVTSPTGTTPGNLGVIANSTGLSPGTYSGTITVSSVSATAVNIESAKARVYFTVRPPATPVVSVGPSAVAFQYANGVLTPASSAISVTSSSPGLTYTASASTARGGNWLTVSPASGTVSATSAVTAGVSSSVAAGLSAGIYTGTVTIKVPGASKSTFTVLASLEVFKTGQTPFFELEPGALLFNASTGAANPVPQSASLLVVGSTSLGWSTKVATSTSAGSWLTVSPASRTGSGTIKVSVDASKLAKGNYSGTVTFSASTGTTKPVTLQVRLYLGTVSTKPAAEPMASVVSTEALFTSPAEGFSRTEGLPVNLSVMVVDGNGAAVDSAVVKVTSSNGEPDLTLDSAGGGLYTGLFQPMGSGTLVLTASTGNTAGDTANAVSGDVQPSDEIAPLVFHGGVVNAASFEASAPVAPGSLVSLFGMNLTSRGGTSSSVPLPFLLGDVSVSVGGLPAALVMADPTGGQINLQVPFGVQGEQADVVVNSNGRLSAPITLQMSDAAPGLFTRSQDGKGAAAALHADYSAISAASPAAAGDSVLLYATGLGALRASVADGAAATGGNATSGVVTITIGGVDAIVDYAGAAPGFPGLYQINARIPAGLASGDAAVVVSVNSVSGSPLATVSVR